MSGRGHCAPINRRDNGNLPDRRISAGFRKISCCRGDGHPLLLGELPKHHFSIFIRATVDNNRKVEIFYTANNMCTFRHIFDKSAIQRSHKFCSLQTAFFRPQPFFVQTQLCVYVCITK